MKKLQYWSPLNLNELVKLNYEIVLCCFPYRDFDSCEATRNNNRTSCFERKSENASELDFFIFFFVFVSPSVTTAFYWPIVFLILFVSSKARDEPISYQKKNWSENKVVDIASKYWNWTEIEQKANNWIIFKFI